MSGSSETSRSRSRGSTPPPAQRGDPGARSPARKADEPVEPPDAKCQRVAAASATSTRPSTRGQST
eukprot:3903-Lingulodinium_polyedra.AAC.1